MALSPAQRAQMLAGVGLFSGTTDGGGAAIAERAADRLAHTGGTGLGSLGARITAIMPDTSALEPAAVEAAMVEGGRMTVDQAVAYALKRDDPR